MEEPDEISLKLLVEDILGRAEIQLITEELVSTEVLTRLQMEGIHEEVNLDEKVVETNNNDQVSDQLVIEEEISLTNGQDFQLETTKEETPALLALVNDNLTTLEPVSSTCVYSEEISDLKDQVDAKTDLIEEVIASDVVVESVNSIEEISTAPVEIVEICDSTEVTESTGVEVETVLSTEISSNLIQKANDLNQSIYDNVGEVEAIENSSLIPGSVPIADVSIEDEIKLRSASSTANSSNTQPPHSSTPKKKRNSPVPLVDPLRHDPSLAETPLERKPLTQADLMNRIESLPMIDDEIEEFEQYKVARLPTTDPVAKSGKNGIVPLKKSTNTDTGFKGRFRKLCCF